MQSFRSFHHWVVFKFLAHYPNERLWNNWNLYSNILCWRICFEILRCAVTITYSEEPACSKPYYLETLLSLTNLVYKLIGAIIINLQFLDVQSYKHFVDMHKINRETQAIRPWQKSTDLSPHVSVSSLSSRLEFPQVSGVQPGERR